MNLLVLNLPRMPYVARNKIFESLQDGSKNWSKLLMDTKLSKAALSTNIRALTKENLVKKSKDGYMLTFLGVVDYFSRRFWDEKFTHEEAKKIIEKYASIIDYPLFTEHQYLEEWLGNEYYSLLLNSADNTRKEIRSRSIVTIAPLEHVEAEWMHAYALQFFQLLLAEPERKLEPPSNLKVIALTEKTYENEISSVERNLTFLRNEKQRLLGTP